MSKKVAKKVKPLEPLDLSTTEGHDKWEEICKTNFEGTTTKLCKRYRGASRFLDFLKTGQLPPIKNGKNFMFVSRDQDYSNSILLRGNMVFDLYDNWPIGCYDDPSIECATGIVVKFKNKPCVICSGDGSDGQESALVDDFANEGFPTLSFNCLAQFYRNREEVVKKLASQELVLVDFVPDQRLPLSAKDKKQIVANKKAVKQNKTPNPIKPPKAGFAIVGRVWHCSATVVLFDNKTEKCYLMGQDGGTYFGCELPKYAKTVEQAFDMLIPPEAKGKHYYRQGEWFAIPIAGNLVPDEKDTIAGFSGNGDDLWPSRKDNAGARHFISASEGFIGKDGNIYCFDLTMCHENGDHGNMDVPGWCILKENLAVRSVSQEGVD